ncbi:MAG: hypothetical protein V8T00_03010 [Oscillospiraceae bacterium]
MSGWVVLGIIVAVFVLIGCIPVGVDARYHENALALRLKIGFFTVQALPPKPKKKKAASSKRRSPLQKSRTQRPSPRSPKSSSRCRSSPCRIFWRLWIWRAIRSEISGASCASRFWCCT